MDSLETTTKRSEIEQKPAAPAIALPKGGGAIHGMGEKFVANPVTGTGSLTVPIAISPGRSGFGPELFLSYDSGAGNGTFGFGWNLSTPSITRKTDKGLPQYFDTEESDVFIFSGAEDLVPVARDDNTRLVAGVEYRIHRYRPRIEGLFARIERWTNTANPADVHWRSISQDNILTVYGKDADSRIADPENADHIFSWLICDTRDDKGNAVLYEYKAEDGAGVDLAQAHERNRGGADDPRRAANRYLKHIRYGNREPLLNDDGQRPAFLTQSQTQNSSWMFEVIFDYGEHDVNMPKPADADEWDFRADPFSSYRPGFEVRTVRLCQRVLMFHHFEGEAGVGNDCLVRSTDLTYSYEPVLGLARNPVYSFLLTVTQSGYKREGIGYIKRSLPPLAFEYTQPVVQDAVETIDPASLENLPIGLDGAMYQWIDLHGEGIPGILSEQGGAWFYKRNLSPINATRDHGVPIEAHLAPLERVSVRPNLDFAGGAQFMDLAGDGQPDLVVMDGPMPGLYEHDGAEGWQPFRPFTDRLNRELGDPNLKFIDLNGDGHADVLISEDDALVWHSSLAEAGFGPARRVAQALDEEQGPRLIFADRTQTIHLADLSGDGLTDLVRIRNGEICYWPNLGYARFGAKITMDHAPCFDNPDQFDQKRIRLTDIDGSGTTDIVYLHRNGVRLYFNQSGNSWSESQQLKVFPRVDDLASIMAIDLLGNNTACLVWSSPLPGDAACPMRYVNLMGAQKPHLLIKTINNLGAETRAHYAPSTKFYLLDKHAGKPWITRLPFPVHVVEQVETYDHISRNRFVSHYEYHHGYFDGEEREFRGFGMVEQWDTETMGALGAGVDYATGDNIDVASYVPPVHTKTWFHTGFYFNRDHISRQFETEYYREPGLNDEGFSALLLPDTHLPNELTLEEERDACRALKGMMLRQEVYADDAGPDASEEVLQRARTPYTVVEQDFTLRRLEPKAGNRHAVFFTHPREAITYHYERNPIDPRVQHALTLEVDDHGNVLKEAAIGYGRRATVWVVDAQGQFKEVRNPGLDGLSAADQNKQTDLLITYTENRVTVAVEEADAYRTPLPCEARSFELTGYTPTGPVNRFRSTDFVEPDPNNPGRLRHRVTDDVAYEMGTTGNPCRRLIARMRTVYRPNDCGASQNDPLSLLPDGELQSQALPGESYQLSFTPGLLAQSFRRDSQPLLSDPASVLGGAGADRGGYVDLDGDGNWWIPSGRVFLSPNTDHSAVDELNHARDHFFLPHRSRDPFHTDAVRTESFHTYDAYNLLMLETRDALNNRITVGERLPDETIDQDTPGNDYRVLQPWRIMDPNRNRTQVAFDTLGMVVGTAVMGKPEESLGDSLDGYVTDLSEAEILAHLSDPLASPQAILGRASGRLIYDIHAYERTKADSHPQSAVAYTLTRETHDAELEPGQQTKIQPHFSYSDGFGREIQQKTQVEPEAVNGLVGPPRWVGSGWTIFNNKGNPVRQFEPFFSNTHRFEFGEQVGVSPVLFYDPLDRVVVTLHPNHTYEKLVFDPWQQTSYDVNDSCAPGPSVPANPSPRETGDPRTDLDISGYVAGYFETQPADWQTWHAQRSGGHMGTREQDAANQAAAHADTPSTAYFDALGRPFLTLAHNGLAADDTPIEYITRIILDIEGNQREVIDALNRVVMRYAYDMLGNRTQQLSMEAGARWMLNDIVGNPIRTWDSRGHNFRTEYDPLRRSLRTYVTGVDPNIPNQALLTDRQVYGEQHPEAVQHNLRGHLYLQLDQAGAVTSDAHDFKGNPLRSTRRIVREYKRAFTWDLVNTALPDFAIDLLVPADVDTALIPLLEDDTYTSITTYDALNRPITITTPHTFTMQPNVIHPTYNEANLLERVDVMLRGATANGEPVWTPFVVNIDYDAKGQRTRIDYGNGTSTFYTYDPLTYRLLHLRTRRNTAVFPADCPQPAPSDWPGCRLQNLHYTYDPVGNITHIHDDAQQTIYFSNRRVEPSNQYTYDALYRLTQATGREHLGQVGHAPIPHSHNDAPRVGIPHPGDGDAMGNYTEKYVYDAVGNFLQMQHHGDDPAHPGWTRHYDYDEASLIETSKMSNRLSHAQLSSDPPSPNKQFAYDAHGNMLQMSHLSLMAWDYHDQLQATAQQVVNNGGTPETTYYVYDAAGQRVRKVTEGYAATGQPKRKSERFYLGGFEIYREYGGNDGVALERETLHIMDDKQRIAMVETLTEGSDPASEKLTRYQIGNHLGSASLELDSEAQVISYEEYSPYGSTTYQAVRSQTETPKRYRYTGKERDEESGLYYHGARYYASWLGRWGSADSQGVADGLNVYLYAHVHPVRFIDPTGNAGEDDFSNLNPIIDDLNKHVKEGGDLNVQELKKAKKQKQVTPIDARQKADAGAAKARRHAKSPKKNPGGVGKPQPGDEMAHMSAARHNAKSDIPNDIANAPENIKAMPGKSKDATVTDNITGKSRTTDLHAAHEDLLNEIQVRNQKGKSPGTIDSSVAAQDALEEAKIKSEYMTREHFDEVEAGGRAKPEKGPPVNPDTGKVLDPAPKVDATTSKTITPKKGLRGKVMERAGKIASRFARRAAGPAKVLAAGMAVEDARSQWKEHGAVKGTFFNAADYTPGVSVAKGAAEGLAAMIELAWDVYDEHEYGIEMR